MDNEEWAGVQSWRRQMGGSTVVRLGVNLRLTTSWSKGQEKGNQRVSYQGAEEIN